MTVTLASSSSSTIPNDWKIRSTDIMRDTKEAGEGDFQKKDTLVTTNAMEEDDDDQGHGVSMDVKLQMLLKDLISVDFKLYTEASKRLVRLFKRDNGGDFLGRYIRSSAECVELLSAWNMRRGKPGTMYVFSVITTILEHPFGRSRASGISRNLDSFARAILKDRLEDIYTELKTKDFKHQSAALRIVASIVRRGMSLASEVATSFDFNLSVLPKLSELQKMKDVKHPHGRKSSTRRAFIEFAMSFLEVGNPELLKRIIQQRFLYSGVLQGLENDDCETLIYILSTVRDRVLRIGSRLPPSLRSVLFGIVTLEQLSHVSGKPEGGPAADLAHEILVMVCTDPINGLMPYSNMKGNPKRLLELMKKLKATEVQHHRNLLLNIVEGRPSLCALYMDVFPYNLEPSVSPLWFSAISLAADLISSTNSSSPTNLFSSSFSHDQPDVNDNEVQHVLKHILPRTVTRSACNKALLHSDVLVKHGCLRLILEILKALDRLFTSIDAVVKSANLDESNSSDCVLVDRNMNSGSECFATVDGYGFHPKSDSPSQYDLSLMKRWPSLRQNIQDEIRTVLPDPQVVLNLLTSAPMTLESRSLLGSKHPKGSQSSSKRCSNSYKISCKRLKTNQSSMEDDTDIIVSGLSLVTNNSIPAESREGIFAEYMDLELSSIMTILDQIWGTYKASDVIKEPKDVEMFFRTKLLDALALYIRTIPKALIGSFDFFKILPTDSSSLSSCQQKSLLSLLVEHTRDPSECKGTSRISDTMYKHLRPLLNLWMHSEGGNKDMAYALARLAMLSTGAFDQNLSEVDVWFLFLPGCKTARYFAETEGTEMFRDLDAAVISFFCVAISTMGNNLYTTLDRMRCRISKLERIGDDYPNFSPLSMIILEKCLRLLASESGVSKESSKTMICLYVSNTLTFLLQSQVEFRSLPALINLLLSEKFNSPFSVDDDHNDSPCEWRPLKSLLIFVRSILHQQTCDLLLCRPKRKMEGNAGPLHKLLSRVKMLLEDEFSTGLYEKSISLFNSILCATSDEILECFPLLVIVAQHLFKGNTRCMLSVFFLNWHALSDVSSNWPDLFLSSLDINEGSIGNSHEYCDANILQCNDPSYVSRKLPIERSNEDEFAVTAFRSFLHNIPFHFIFICALNLGSYNAVACKKLLEVLQARLCNGDFKNSLLSLHVVLFWAYQIRTVYQTKPSETLERLFQICSVLIEDALEYFFPVKHENTISGSTRRHSQEECFQVVELIIFHPVIMQSLANPLSSSEEVDKEFFCRNFDDIIVSSKQTLNSVDHCILRVFNKMGNLLITSGKQKPSCSIFSVSGSVGKAFKDIIRCCIDSFKRKFDLCIEKKDLSPLFRSFCILHGLTHLMPPFGLLELVDWLLLRVDHHFIDWKSTKISALSVALCVAYSTFDVFSCHLDQQGLHITHPLFLESTDRASLMCLLENVVFKILKFSTCFTLELADMCLLKAVDIMYDQCFFKPIVNLLPFNVNMLRTLISSPLGIIRLCIHNPNKAKSRLLYKLSELSPLHSRLFGMTLFDIIDNDPSSASVNVSGSFKVEKTIYGPDYAFTNEDFLLLLPSALSFLTSNLPRGWDREAFLIIPRVYSRILLDIISNWKEKVSTDIFYEDHVETISQYEDCQRIFRSTLLGKAACMLQYFFTLSEDPIGKKQRLKVFDSIHHSEGLLSDIDVTKSKALSYGDLFNVINKVIGKISFTWLLLFPPENPIDVSPSGENGEDAMQTSSTEKSKREKHAKLKFMDLLVGALNTIVSNTSRKNGSYKEPNCADGFHLMQYLEIFILRCILRLATKASNILTGSKSVSFLEAFIKSSLLHRFDDPCTLRAMRNILNALKGGFNACEVLELLLGHSKFFGVILGDNSVLSSGRVHSGTFLQSTPSVFRLISSSPFHGPLDQSSTTFVQINSEHAEDIKLELIKLLRFLYPLARSDRSGTSTNTKELLYLLLSGYGASVDETDLEIFQLISDLSIDNQGLASISDVDYLWGASALKVWKVLKACSADDKTPIDCEKIQEENRRIFRENVVIDAKVCAATVLNFCYGWSKSAHVKSMEKTQQCNYMHLIDAENQQQQRQENSCGTRLYEPRFMLRLANNSLLKGYIEPLEFTRLGLLAIALVSISSPDEDLRRLGYDVLGSFQKALAIHQKEKDVIQLQLLLAYLQNGITEPWQKIPSITAIFVAEASLILLDTFHDHFHAITKLLTGTRKMNLEEIPLFRTFFQNSSVNFKKERLWILRLIYIGLNLEDDAQILMSRFIIEQLLSFYTSSLSDRESKILILQILRKSVKLHALACRLVMDCGLFLWLYSILQFHGERLHGDQKELSLLQMETVLKVILEVIPLKTVNQWLKNKALEQMSEVSRYLIKLSVSSIDLLKGNISLLNSIFNVISSTMGISLKRKVYHPHFTLSLEGLFQLCQVMDKELRHTRFDVAVEFGLRTLLMSTPPAAIFFTDKAKVSKIVLQAIRSALPSYQEKVRAQKKSVPVLLTSRDYTNEESYLEKLLRWVTASVILGCICSRFSKTDVSSQRSKGENMQTLLLNIKLGKMRNGECAEEDCKVNRDLAVIILHLQQLLAMKTTVLPSVIFALYLLLLDDDSNSAVRVLLSGDKTNFLLSFCSKIRRPAEFSPAWRWSFYNPWKDESFEQSKIESAEEEHACQALLLAFSNSLRVESSERQFLSLQNLESLFSWEMERIC